MSGVYDVIQEPKQTTNVFRGTLGSGVASVALQEKNPHRLSSACREELPHRQNEREVGWSE